jgi:GH3 auxin-responsive promoter
VGRLLRTALLAHQFPSRVAFARATARPEVAQTRRLREILRRNARTAFGRDHGFADITGPSDYARRVPIGDYEAFRPYIRRVAGGERGVLTEETPFMFATTSGTTGEPKLVPVTPSWRDEMAGVMRLWTSFAVRDHGGMFDRDVLTIVSPAVEGRTESGVPFGAMSGLAYERLPALIRRKHVLPDGVALIGDYDTRYFVTMRLALARSVSSLGTPNPSTLLRLAETASSRGPEIIRAIHDGVLGVDLSAPSPPARDGRDLGRELAAGLRPRPDRAAALERILHDDGRLTLARCWPDLALVACWLGGNAGIQARRLAGHYGDSVPLRDLGLIASEGRLTIPVDDHSPAGILAIHTTFFEFIPEEEVGETPARTLLAHELELGRRYYLVLTGANGLYRYDLNDTVEVRGFHGRTPMVAFVRKGRDMVSITGEKLHLNQIQDAIREAERTTQREVGQFSIIPDVEASRYDLLVELEGGASATASLADFLATFDRTLASVNIEYAAKRGSKRLAGPRLHLMRPGWAEKVCRREFSQGRRESQHKWKTIRVEWDDASRAEVVETLG